MQPQLYIDPKNISGTNKGIPNTAYNFGANMSAPDTSAAGLAGAGLTGGTTSDGLTVTGTGSQSGPGINVVEGASTSFQDPAAAQAAQAQAVAKAQAGLLRGEITNLITRVKDIFNSRYGQVDAQAADVNSKLTNRYATEAGDVSQQAQDENSAVGAAYAGRGTFDSSYRSNSNDIVSQGADRQIRDLGTDLEADRAAVGGEASRQKGEFDSKKASLDVIAQQIASATDPAELTSLKQSLESRIAEMSAGGSEYNTQAQNLASLNSIVPTNAQAVQLKTTLSKVLAGNMEPGMKLAMGQRILSNSGLNPDEQQRLLAAFSGDVENTDKTA